MKLKELLKTVNIDFDEDIYAKKLGYSKEDKSFVVKAFNTLETVQIKDVSKIDNFIPKYELREFDVKSLAVVPMHNNAHVVGVIVIENYKEKTIKRAYMNLLETIARLFGTSMHLQKIVEQTEDLINDEKITIEELQHMRAELTALIGDLGVNQQSFVENLAKAVDEKGQFTSQVKMFEGVNVFDSNSDVVRYLKEQRQPPPAKEKLL